MACYRATRAHPAAVAVTGNKAVLPGVHDIMLAPACTSHITSVQCALSERQLSIGGSLWMAQ